MIIGLSGKIASGKTTVANYLQEKYHFANLSTRKLLSEILVSQDRKVSRENLQMLGSQLVETAGAGGFIAIMLAYLPKGNYVIDAIRYPEAVDYLRRRFPEEYKHLHVSANDLIRQERMGRKEDIKDAPNPESFEKAETEASNLELERKADLVIRNEGGLVEFYSKIDALKIFG